MNQINNEIQFKYRRSGITYFILLWLVLVGLNSCHFFGHTTRTSSKEKMELFESIVNDSSMCYLPLVEIVDKSFLTVLDSIIILKENCEYCNTDVRYPGYYSFYPVTKKKNEGFSVSFYTNMTQLKDKSADFFGGFYYKNNLFVVELLHQTSPAVFAKTDCQIPIFNCSFNIHLMCSLGITILSNQANGFSISQECESGLIWVE